eukprot:m.311977 g.311977  ORF g.311977 m.311977 type:complete len:308 (+) comp189547_c0_seq1:404-1327(+)
MNNLCANNVCTFVDFASQYDGELYNKCWRIINVEATKVLASDAFAKCLSMKEALTIVKCDTLQSDEIGVFNAVARWIQHHGKTGNYKELLCNVRYGLLNTYHLVGPVQESGLVDDKVILSAVTHLHYPQKISQDSPERPLCNSRLVLAFDKTLSSPSPYCLQRDNAMNGATTIQWQVKGDFSTCLRNELVLAFAKNARCKLRFEVKKLCSESEVQYLQYPYQQQQQTYSAATLSILFKTPQPFGIQGGFRGGEGSQVIVSSVGGGVRLGCCNANAFVVDFSASESNMIDFEMPGISFQQKVRDLRFC